jgi:hypothetical protein
MTNQDTETKYEKSSDPLFEYQALSPFDTLQRAV